MAEEVIIHGDFVQFNGTVRCEACQSKNLKCALQQNDEGCMACAGANRDCIFSRTVVISGPKSKFDWNTLLNRHQAQAGVAARTPASSVAFTPRIPFLENLPNEQSPDQQARQYRTTDRVLPPPRQSDGLITTPFKSLAHINTAPESLDSRPRSGVDPAARLPLGDIVSLTEQTQELELAKTNARVGQWLDQCMLGPLGASYAQEPPERPSTARSGVTDEAENGSPGLSPEMQVDVKDEDIVPANPTQAFDGRPTRPAAAFLTGKRPEQAPTLEAHPWVDISVFPPLEKNDAQPITSNDAIMRFSHRARATEEASRCAVHGDHPNIMESRMSHIPNSHSRTNSNLDSSVEALNRSMMSRSTLLNNFVPPGNTPLARVGTDPQALGYSPYYPSPPRLLPRQYTTIAPSQPPTSTLPQAATYPAVSQEALRRQEEQMPLSPKSGRNQSIIKATPTKPIPHDTTPTAKVRLTDPCDTFEQEIQDNSPRLPEFLLKRLTQEQSRRYKRLMSLKLEHYELAHQEGCPSGSLCIEGKYYNGIKAGGFPGLELMKPAKQNQYSAEDRENSVELTSLSPNYPVPPSQGLPSEFECPFCFKVKKCLKPSDWAKHFCEDLQPFVCSFEQCTDPKSFKRKADWIRHENERHRQLERWVCNIVDCSHICYRKDNFVQHLVREHKMPEPKPRSDPRSNRVPYYRPSGSEVIDVEQDSVWTLVEECREEEPKSPKDEPCKFCGTVCSSWKKLSNHLAKHMEDIAFPVWKVVLQSDVSDDPPKSPQSPESPAVPPQPTAVPFKESPSARRISSKSDQDSVSTDVHERSYEQEPGIRGISIPPSSSHFATVNKPYRCDAEGCIHDRGFATQTDLKRHRKGVHGIYDEGNSDQTFYRCQGKDCKDADKVWPRRDNFRGHLSRKHAEEDIEELTEKSTFRSPSIFMLSTLTEQAPSEIRKSSDVPIEPQPGGRVPTEQEKPEERDQTENQQIRSADQGTGSGDGTTP